MAPSTLPGSDGLWPPRPSAQQRTLLPGCRLPCSGLRVSEANSEENRDVLGQHVKHRPSLCRRGGSTRRPLIQ